MSNLTKYLTTILLTILITIGLMLGIGYYFYPYLNTNSTNKQNTNNSTNTTHKETIFKETTTVLTKPKETPDEPDVSIKNNYTVEIDGDKIEIPKNHKGELTHDVDLTPIIQRLADAEYKRNWEVGAGLGRSHNGHWYVPVSFQRNYNYDKAVEVQIGFAKDHIENAQVVHKWKF